MMTKTLQKVKRNIPIMMWNQCLKDFSCLSNISDLQNLIKPLPRQIYYIIVTSPSINLSVCLPIRLSICTSICLSVHASPRLSIFRLCVNQFVWSAVYFKLHKTNFFLETITQLHITLFLHTLQYPSYTQYLKQYQSQSWAHKQISQSSFFSPNSSEV